MLRTHDRFGNRIDEVEFHPAWHELMTVAVGARPAGRPVGRPAAGRAHGPRGRAVRVGRQPTPAICCPISMTYAIVPALRHAPELARRYEPLLTARVYDPGSAPARRASGACWPACP